MISNDTRALVEALEKLRPLIARCATYGWNGIESTMFRVTSEQAKALCDLDDARQALAALSPIDPSHASPDSVSSPLDSAREIRLAELDARLYGIGFLVNGRRVHPAEVKTVRRPK